METELFIEFYLLSELVSELDEKNHILSCSALFQCSQSIKAWLASL